MQKAKRLFITLAILATSLIPTFSSAQTTEPQYDVNRDGVVTVDDAIAVLNYIKSAVPTATAVPPVATATVVASATPLIVATVAPANTATKTATPTKTATVTRTPTKTSTPVPTVAPATVTPVPTMGGMAMGICGEDMNTWHSPTIDGCDTRHEHGDGPPAWVMSSGKLPVFNHAHSTGPIENAAKHNFMKGYLMPDRDKPCLVMYAIQHGGAAGMERIAQLHSTQFWIKDCSGGVSYGSFDTDFGKNGIYPAGMRAMPANFDAVHQAEANRGIIRVATAENACEQWYGAVFGNKPDASLLFCGSSEYFNNNEVTNPTGEYDPANWGPGAGLDLFRQFELVWPSDRILVGNYTTDQFGNVVNSCSGTVDYDGVTYTRTCAPWVIKQTFLNDVLSKAPEFGFRRAFFLYRNEDIFCGPQCSFPN